MDIIRHRTSKPLAFQPTLMSDPGSRGVTPESNKIVFVCHSSDNRRQKWNTNAIYVLQHRRIIFSVLVVLILGPSIFLLLFNSQNYQSAAVPLHRSPKQTESYFTVRKPPVINRSVLDRLERMQESEDPDERPSVVHPPDYWPPLITRIPEPLIARFVGTFPISSDYNPNCSVHPNHCRFLLPLRISEQESKARLHFIQLVQLARELDRTLVLPNVGKSRIGTCLKWDFDKYYDVEKFSSNFESLGGRVVTMDQFKRWSMAQANMPTGQAVLVSTKNSEASPDLDSGPISSFEVADVIVSVDHDSPNLQTTTACLETRFQRLRLTVFSPLSIRPAFPANNLKAHPIGNSIVDALLHPGIQAAAFRPIGPLPNNGIPSQPDVLVVNWDLRHPAFPPQASQSLTLEYSPRLTSFASNLVTGGGYLAIHWRMETVPPYVLSDCADALVETLFTLLSSNHPKPTVDVPGIRTVWFASDYPCPISSPGCEHIHKIAKSGTFKGLQEEHEEAVQILRMAFEPGGPLASWNITGLEDTLSQSQQGGLRGDLDEALLEDSGVLGILDKLILSAASHFVTGTKKCSRISSYTKQVTEARSHMKENKENRHQINVADYFG